MAERDVSELPAGQLEDKPPVDQLALESTTNSQTPALTTSNTFSSRIWRHLRADVRPSNLAEVELLLLTFCTGLQGKFTTLRGHTPHSLTPPSMRFLSLISIVSHPTKQATPSSSL